MNAVARSRPSNRSSRSIASLRFKPFKGKRFKLLQSFKAIASWQQPLHALSKGRRLRASRTFSSVQTASQSLRARVLPSTGAISS